MKSSRVVLAALLAASQLFVNLRATRADDAGTNSPPAAAKPAEKAPPPEKGAPLPLHQIEGNGGIFSTLSAYIVNPPRNGEPVGRPAAGFSFVDIGHGQNLEALTLTESPWKRLELGYGWDYLDLGDLPLDIKNVTKVSIHEQDVQLHNFNARLQLLQEGEFNQKWLPALTFGFHFKYNDGIGKIDEDLGGALSSAGIKHHDGEDYTLYASKLITQLPRPVLIEAGGRATEGVWNGLGGFTSKYDFLFEGNVVVFVTGNFALAAEYREQPNEYKPIGNLVKKEGDWWTLDAAYVVNNHFTLAAGYGHFGNVLNHEADGVWGITTKWEF
ncbi:MAG: DUF3034 family protein [Verrucomicrobiia bacterium]|jgi:hypothetical protein